MPDSVAILIALAVIVVAAEVFTNAVEHLGARLKIAEGVTGSLFAAVATALPETSVPLIALFAGTADQQVNEEIGVGAILGAPVMLATLAMFLLTAFSAGRRGLGSRFTPEASGLGRDLNVFLGAFVLATLAMFVPPGWPAARAGFSIVLVLIYFVYVLSTLRASAELVANGHSTEAHKAMFLNRLGLPDNFAVVGVQLVLGLGSLVGGAKLFIHEVEGLAHALGVSALLLSLVVVPVATELPEKVNSILWIRRRRDTLAFGNITGAMVFQGTLLPAVGIMLTPWSPRPEVLAGALVTLAGAAWLRWRIAAGGIRLGDTLVNGLLYATYLGVMVAAAASASG
ncbi:MAG TPA: sodium:calcium antiporter [Gammaproteobacteria bacterium]|nr:sodium:calcium antiporter [Gammaproteobacteria bacterium]